MEEKEIAVKENENAEIIVFDEDAIKKEVMRSFKQLGVGCCKSAKESVAPLASSLVKHFFDWLIVQLQQD